MKLLNTRYTLIASFILPFCILFGLDSLIPNSVHMRYARELAMISNDLGFNLGYIIFFIIYLLPSITLIFLTKLDTEQKILITPLYCIIVIPILIYVALLYVD